MIIKKAFTVAVLAVVSLPGIRAQDCQMDKVYLETHAGSSGGNA